MTTLYVNDSLRKRARRMGRLHQHITSNNEGRVFGHVVATLRSAYWRLPVERPSSKKVLGHAIYNIHKLVFRIASIVRKS